MRARQEWDERMGLSLAHARNWRITALAMIVCTSMVCAAFIVSSNQRKVFPIVVALNPQTGEPVVLGDSEKLRRTPGDLEIKYFLSEFIRLVRTVPLDPVLLKQNWLRSYSYLRKDAAGYLNQLTSEDNESPLKKLGAKAVAVQPLSVVPIPQTKSFQVRWKESVYSSAGQKLDEYTMLGTFSIEFEDPKDELSIRDNPLGIFVRQFQWNREL
jgi:type IV secretion system protein VirB5